MLVWLLSFVALGAAGTWLARRYALSRSLIDEPGERRSHAIATPRGGGLAILCALLVAVAWLALRMPGHPSWLPAFAFGVVAVGLIGLVDDHRPLPASVRLCVHVAAAAVFALALGSGASPVLAAGAFLACVALVNVWNFMDGINGIAATQAALVAFALAAATGGATTWLALALAGACLGFLPFNLPRARIFLGDVGSGVLGFAIAALAASVVHESPASWPMVALAPSAFLVDSAATLLRRVVRGERWWTPHAQHAYQVCARRWGHARVTSAYGAWTLAAVALASAAASLEARFMVALVMAWYTLSALLWLWLQQLEPQRRAH